MGDVYLPEAAILDGEIPGHLVYNLEAPLTQHTRGWPGTVNLRCQEDHSAATFRRIPLAVCLANNHIMDFGPEGLTETIERLEATGVACFGAGTRSENCRNPEIVCVGGHKLALIGYVCPSTHPVFAEEHRPGVATISLDNIRADVLAARLSGATRVVVSLHWGIEEIELPRPEDVHLARAVAEFEVDLIIGHHAHCIQPFEIYNGVPIFYGLGNAIFPDVDAWANYSNDGTPGEPFRKLQNYWNRDSLGVRFDLETGAVAVDRWTCDGDRLRLLRRNATSPQLAYSSAARYEARFRKHHFFAVWRKKLVNYVRRPSLPQPRHLRSILNILRESRSSGA